MRHSWNDDEDEALDYLPHVDQIIYLRGIRKRMNYQTGIAGGDAAPLSYQWLAQLVEVHLQPGSHAKSPPRMAREALRASFRRLEKAGLIQWLKTGGRGLFFRCLLADVDQSVSRRNNLRTTPEQPQANNPGNDIDNNELSDRNNLRTTLAAPAKNNPIPETGIRLISTSVDVLRPQKQASAGLGSDESAPKAAIPQCPHQQIIDLYHRLLPDNPRVRTWEGERPKLLRAFWKRHPDLEWIEGYFAYCARSDFLTGKTSGSGDRPPFVADLEWLIRPRNFQKVHQGNYHRTAGGRQRA